MLDVLTYLFYLLSKPNIPKTDLRCKGTTKNAHTQVKREEFSKLIDSICPIACYSQWNLGRYSTYTNLFPHLHLYNVPLGMGHPDSN